MANLLIVAVCLLSLASIGSAAQNHRFIARAAAVVTEGYHDVNISSTLSSTITTPLSSQYNTSTTLATSLTTSSTLTHNHSPWSTISATPKASLSTQQANYSTTITPSACSGTKQRGIGYITVTVTEIDTITAASLSANQTVPTLIVPIPFCPAWTLGRVSVIGPKPTPIAPFLSQTIHATVKTTVLAVPESAPAITFGGQPASANMRPGAVIPVETPGPIPSEPDHGPTPNNIVFSPGPGFNSIPIEEPSFPDPVLDPPPSQPSQPNQPSQTISPEPATNEPPQSPSASPEQDAGHSDPQEPRPVNLNFGSSPQIVLNGITIAAHSTDAVIGGQTFSADKSTTAVQTVDGHAFSILPSGRGVVGPAGLTVPALPAMITPPPSVVKIGNQAFTAIPLHPSEIEVDGSTIHVPDSGVTVFTVSHSLFTLSASQIIADGSTVALPTAGIPSASDGNIPSMSVESVDNITFDLGSGEVVIDGQTLAIGAGAPTSTLVMSGETVIVGPSGLIFPTTTVGPLPPAATFMTVDGIEVELQSTDVVIGGTTYDYSKPTAIVDGFQTISIGTFGVEIASTTISPPRTTITTPAASITPSLPNAASQFSSHPASPTTTSGSSPLSVLNQLVMIEFTFVFFWLVC